MRRDYHRAMPFCIGKTIHPPGGPYEPAAVAPNVAASRSWSALREIRTACDDHPIATQTCDHVSEALGNMDKRQPHPRHAPDEQR
jgi:hypothetical protein